MADITAASDSMTETVKPRKKTVGELLREHRKMLGLSQTTVGLLIGASQFQISAVEREVGRLKPDQIKRLELLWSISLADEDSDHD